MTGWKVSGGRTNYTPAYVIAAVMVAFALAAGLGFPALRDAGLPTPDLPIGRQLKPDALTGLPPAVAERRVNENAAYTWIVIALAGLGPLGLWGFVGQRALRRFLARDDMPEGVPEYIREEPSAHDPAVVSALWEAGKPAEEAVAATVLAMAERKLIRVDQLGPGRFALALTGQGTVANPGESIVLDALRAEAGEDGRIEGPPLWRRRPDWIGRFGRDAVSRARSEGLLLPVFGRGLIGAAAALTGTAVGIVFFPDAPAAMGATAVGSTAASQFIAVAAGYVPSEEGRRLRAEWAAYRRHLRDFTEIDELGPAGVVLWGKLMAYGVVLDSAGEAAKQLEPG